ncbi:MAG: gliding motility-associated C-terminal domain-containing protein [Bacteroidia bacterium]
MQILLALFFALELSAQTQESVSTSSLEMVPNHGQWHPAVRYKVNIPYGQIFLRQDGIVYDLLDSEQYVAHQEKRHDQPANRNNSSQIDRHSIELKFLGLEYSSKIYEEQKRNHYYNFYLGEDKSKWASAVHPVGKIKYKNVYPGVDLEFITDQDFKYQWVIHQANEDNIAQIQCEINGADSIQIIDQQLHIFSSVGTIIEDQPLCFQIVEGKQLPVLCDYQVNGNVLSYVLQSELVANAPLIIDPKLIFSTYSGSVGDNFGYTATYDSEGNLYAGGIVDNRGPYPVTDDAHDTIWNGGVGRSPVNLRCDITISKYDSAGTQLLWASFLGGSDDEYPHSIVVDRDDQLILLGTTHSPNFPFTKDCYDSTYNGNFDIIVSKFSEDGSELMASTYVGGSQNDGLVQAGSVLAHNYADDFRGDIIPDDDYHVFIASNTNSDNLNTVLPSQVNLKGGQDAFIFELNRDFSQMEWATYLGGGGLDASYSIKLDQNNNVFVGGGTNSDNLPALDTSYQPTRAGLVDGYIAVYNKTDKTLKRLSYYGTQAYDQIYFIDIDRKGNIYATGQTEGNITKSSGVYGEDNRGQFIFKIDTGLLNLEWQTTFGNTVNRINLAPSAFLVDVCEHIYFSGWGSRVSNTNPGSTNGMETTGDAEQSETDNNDFYILVLDKDASGLLYATYFGGDSTSDHVDGGTSRFDKKGVIYQSVCSSCPSGDDLAVNTSEINDFPVSPNAAFTYNSSVRCSNASFKIDLQIKTAVIADFIATPTIGCAPFTVTFNNKSVLGNEWEWDFGDNTTSTAVNPTHEYTEPGLYEVTLTVIDSNTCNISDVYKRSILVIEQGNADFEIKYQACADELEIIDHSEDALSYSWDFGDGNTSDVPNPEHWYEEDGEYTIRLIVNEDSYCADTISQIVNISKIGDKDFTLYNVFSPNNDQLNDCFRFDGLDQFCEGIVWKVYNRWGEKVFETTDPNLCWNGKYMNSGVDLPGSTYFYILDLNTNSLSSQNLITGTITLIR